MNYQLAKELKEAGFQMPLFNQIVALNENTDEYQAFIEPPESDSEVLIPPRLNELILACGEDFRTLLLHTQYTRKLTKPWEAVPNKKRRPEVKSTKASNPTEAVAYLWLALNKKA